MKKEIRIRSLTEYINRITGIKTDKRENPFLRKELVFRGQPDCQYQLVPSIGREISEKWSNTLVSAEPDLTAEALQKFPDFFRNDDYPITKLAKLQHFGVPTRLLDVSSSPLVALYFACLDKDNDHPADGEVFVFSSIVQKATNPFVNIIADLHALSKNYFIDLSVLRYRALCRDYSISLLHKGWEQPTKSELSDLKQQLSNFFVVEAHELSARQKAQQGKYILFPNLIKKDEESGRYYDYGILSSLEKDDKMIIKRFIIPGNMKKQLLEKLDRLGINESSLFGDDIEKVFAHVKKHQSDRFS